MVDKHLQAKSKAPHTLTSHLTSLQLFITYITGWKCDLNLMPPLSPDLKFTLAQLIPALQGWRACIDSFSQHSQLQNYIAECHILITNEDIQNLCTSKPYLEGARIIKEAKKGPPTQHQVVHPCQGLIVVQLDNGHRHKTRHPQQGPGLRL